MSIRLEKLQQGLEGHILLWRFVVAQIYQLKISQLDSFRSTPPTHLFQPKRFPTFFFVLIDFNTEVLPLMNGMISITVAMLKLDFSFFCRVLDWIQTNDRRSGLVISHSSPSCASGLRESSETIPITFHTLHSFASDEIEMERNLFDVIFFRMQNAISLRNKNEILFFYIPIWGECEWNC